MPESLTGMTRHEFECWIRDVDWLHLSTDDGHTLYLTPAGVIVCVSMTDKEVIIQGKGDYVTKAYSLRFA